MFRYKFTIWFFITFPFHYFDTAAIVYADGNFSNVTVVGDFKTTTTVIISFKNFTNESTSGDFSGDTNMAMGRSFFTPCSFNPCQNGGNCEVVGNSYTCICPNGFTGTNCDITRTLSTCSSNPCANGGRCKPYTGLPFTCECANPYSGPTCRDLIPTPNNRHCYQNACLNGGTCIEIWYGYVCSCTLLYTGPRCEQTIPGTNACNPNPCANGGLCTALDHLTNSNTRFACVCSQGFTGIRCEIIVPKIDDVCYQNPCKGDCQCKPSCQHSAGYYCQSSSGYLGKDCTIPPPRLICAPNVITIEVEDAFVKEYEQGLQNSKLVMSAMADKVLTSSHSCMAFFDGYKHVFRLPLPFKECGTVFRQGSDGSTIFINNIWLNRVTASGFDMPVPVIGFECTYTKEYNVVTRITPAQDPPPVFKQQGPRNIGGSIELCKDPFSCPSACQVPFALTQGAVYTVGEMIHLNIRRTDSAFQSIVALDQLFLSCGDQANAQSVVTLVTGGCPVNSLPTVVSHSGRSSSVCVSFEVPKLSQCEVFFIHAKLENCHQSGCVAATNCVSSSPAFGRKKRSSISSDNDIFLGPIHVITGSYGKKNQTIFRENVIAQNNLDINKAIFEKEAFRSQEKAVYRNSDISRKADDPNTKNFPTKKEPPVTLRKQARPNIKSSTVGVKTAIMIVIVASFCLLVAMFVFVVVYLRICRSSATCSCTKR